jgi:hypothetical protein
MHLFLPRHGHGRALVVCARLLLLAAMMILAAACGRAAEPRASQPNANDSAALPPTSAGTPQAAPGAGAPAQQASDARAIGDPSAPITVIEYGDYQ